MANGSNGGIPPGAGALVFSGFTPVFTGVKHGVGVASVATFDNETPRIQRINAFKIDLNAEGIDFVTTPLAQEGTGGSNGYTTGDTVTGFMSANPSVMVAINANFTYCSGMHDSIGADYGILGYVVSNHAVVSDPTLFGWNPDGAPYTLADVRNCGDSGAQALVVRHENNQRIGSIETVSAKTGLPAGDVYLAVSGSPEPGPNQSAYAPKTMISPPLQLVENGNNNAWSDWGTTSAFVAARVGIGLDEAGLTLYFVVLDGCEYNAVPYGGDFCDIAQWMIKVGAYNAINVDGGGSAIAAMRTSVFGYDNSTQAATYTLGPPSVLSIPYGNESALPACQRPLGVFLGVIASPVSPPPSGTT